MKHIIKEPTKKNMALCFSVLFFVLGIAASLTYRPYVYQHNIFDFHIADTIGSFVCVPSSSLFFYAVSSKYRFPQCILLCSGVYILWELLGLAGIHGVFDYYDILAVCISGLACYGMYVLIKKSRTRHASSVHEKK